MEAETANHCTVLMMLHDNVFDKYRDERASKRKQQQIKTGQNQGKEEGQTPKVLLKILLKGSITDYA
jgi:hypothetical protein